MTGELCPSLRLTETTSTPALIRAEAWQCLKLWKVTGDTPGMRLITLFHWTLILPGARGEPSSLQNTKASAGDFPRPRRIRSSSCSRLCLSRSSTALGGNVIFRRPCFVLGDLNRSPAFVCSRLLSMVRVLPSRSRHLKDRSSPMRHPVASPRFTIGPSLEPGRRSAQRPPIGNLREKSFMEIWRSHAQERCAGRSVKRNAIAQMKSVCGRASFFSRFRWPDR